MLTITKCDECGKEYSRQYLFNIVTTNPFGDKEQSRRLCGECYSPILEKRVRRSKVIFWGGVLSLGLAILTFITAPAMNELSFLSPFPEPLPRDLNSYLLGSGGLVLLGFCFLFYYRREKSRLNVLGHKVNRIRKELLEKK